nr:hypothetical protein [Tanacetum cinerariifolium]
RDLARECAEQPVWEPVARFALSGALKSHEHLKSAKSEDWTNLALAYLRISSLLPQSHGGEQISGVLEGFSGNEVPLTGE